MEGGGKQEHQLRDLAARFLVPSFPFLYCFDRGPCEGGGVCFP